MDNIVFFKDRLIVCGYFAGFHTAALINGDIDYDGELAGGHGFPGLGLGALLSNSTVVTDDMVSAASQAAANSVTEQELEDARRQLAEERRTSESEGILGNSMG